MKFYVTENKRLIVEMHSYDKFDTQATGFVPIPKTKILISEKRFLEELTVNIREAIASVLKEYQSGVAELPLKPVFDEKRKQIQHSYDTEEAVADIIRNWDCATLSEEDWI
ncbi:hypothetical protein GGG87_03695 [Streptococcus sp. zg-86]|uniref:Uncharacterized protein n=1 Tax=Streptococcus zhangguiae TaxID=2664091 RepID=A0A6I4RHX9_9STRE|nr:MULTISPECIES: hypothetical protein [unclassified Streptococcus]MTB64105.1 hypothetical protein [Streptococcus sp. zg-86]MTB90569.1 hypothetical protein [Streptococcus sp. zg-36]MWV56093.1 hypothetical protein [Streptococcus sp. zg-70]QTH48278.1 hypothetical protein J5M87_02825 [Streptococcus sp. zg-86]